MQNNFKKLWVAAFLAAAIVFVSGFSAIARADEHKTNACGCYQKSDGSCVCGRGSKCGCPEECEPKGCEEKRAKQLEKEIQVETKKAEDAQRRQRVRQDDSDDAPTHGGRSSSDQERGGDRSGPAKSAPVVKPVKIVKMTPAQKRDLAKLIAAYLAEHPDQGGRAIDQVQSEMRQR